MKTIVWKTGKLEERVRPQNRALHLCWSRRKGNKPACGFKGLVHPKMKVLSLFAHPSVVLNPYELFCGTQQKF